MEILHSPPLTVNIFVKKFFVHVYLNGKVEFKLGFCFSSVLPAHPNNFFVLFLSSLSLLPEELDSLFLPEPQEKLPVHPCQSFSLLAQLAAQGYSLLLHLKDFLLEEQAAFLNPFTLQD